MDRTTQNAFRLLVVDDNEAIHADLKKILQPRAGDDELLSDEALLFGKVGTPNTTFEIDSAFQGQQGLEMVVQAQAAGRPYALAFVDVRMPPGWDGIETIAHVWRRDPNLQVVICTAYSDYNWQDISERLGISQNLMILKKPFDPIEVIQLAHGLTAKWVAAQQAALRMQELDRMVEERTTQLRATVIELVKARDLAEETSRHLKQSQEMLSAAEDLTRSGAWKWDASSGMIELSDGAQKIFGLSKPTQTVIEMMRCVHPDELAGLEQHLFEARKGGTHFTLEHRIECRASGELKVVQANGQVVRDEHGKIVNTFGAVQDVTEARRVETQFRQVQRMEAVGRLAGGVAHDFNNLLGVLMAQTEVLRDESDEGSRVHTCAEEILETLDRATQLTRQLLNIGRQQAPERATLDLHAVLQDTESLIKRLVGDEVILARTLAATRHTVMGSAEQLNQVIMNLVVNARDAMPHGGCLSISTMDAGEDDPVAARLGKPCVVLTVTDDGVGIDDETKAKIFDPFFTTKERGKGTGLGLSTVYGIVQSHGGAIEVKSKPGFGTSFLVYLPTVEKPLRAPKPELVSNRVEGVGTILLTEDEDSLRGLLRRFLESGGYKVIEAVDTQEAIRHSQQNHDKIDLLVTDVVMPVMSGKELAQELKSHRPGLKVLFISGYADNVLSEYDFVKEQARFLQKPFSRGTLLEKVREVLAS